MKATSRRIQLSDVKLKKLLFISYQRLTTQKHSASIDLFYSSFSFYEHIYKQFMHFFIFKTVRCVFVGFFFALRGTASPLKMFYMLHSTKNLKKT